MTAPQRVLVVDDEALARRAIVRQLAEVLPDALIREARDGFDALEALAAFSPSIVFLDIEMPELSGLDVLRQMSAPRPKIVFVTAFEKFAVEAFEENACDYVVKPFSATRFATALSRALRELDSDAKLRSLERSLEARGHKLERLAFRTGTRLEMVPVGDIACFVSRDHYTYAYAGDREHLTELSLVHLEERLDGAMFARVHRTALVNVRRMLRMSDGETPHVELDNGMRLPLSRRSRTRVRELWRGS